MSNDLVNCSSLKNGGHREHKKDHWWSYYLDVYLLAFCGRNFQTRADLYGANDADLSPFPGSERSSVILHSSFCILYLKRSVPVLYKTYGVQNQDPVLFSDSLLPSKFHCIKNRVMFLLTFISWIIISVFLCHWIDYNHFYGAFVFGVCPYHS